MFEYVSNLEKGIFLHQISKSDRHFLLLCWSYIKDNSLCSLTNTFRFQISKASWNDPQEWNNCLLFFALKMAYIELQYENNTVVLNFKQQ